VCVFIYIHTYIYTPIYEGKSASLGKEKAVRCRSRKLVETVERLAREGERVLLYVCMYIYYVYLYLYMHIYIYIFFMYRKLVETVERLGRKRERI